jgi:protein-tyrosine phosphatase
MFLEMYRSHVQCSHIINIYEKSQGPKEKGNLYLSGVAALKEGIKKDYGIDCVLSIIDRWTYDSYHVKNHINKHGVQHHKWIDIEDIEDESIYPFLEEAHSYIKQNLEKHNVLVHCQMGISRSSSLVIAFLMKEYGISFKKARDMTR